MTGGKYLLTPKEWRSIVAYKGHKNYAKIEEILNKAEREQKERRK